MQNKKVVIIKQASLSLIHKHALSEITDWITKERKQVNDYLLKLLKTETLYLWVQETAQLSLTFGQFTPSNIWAEAEFS